MSDLQNNPCFHPHVWQSQLLLHKSKRIQVLTGRQSGKTTFLRQKLYATALGKPDQEILVTAPTYGSVKRLLWKPFTSYSDPLFDPRLIRHRDNTGLILELINGTTITFKGTENIDALLGYELDLLLLDEWQSHKPDIWKYLEPTLATRNGTAIFTGTARRGNHIMDFYEKGQTNPDWHSTMIPTPVSGSPAGEPEAIRLAKSSMSEEEFQQEYLCIPMLGEGLCYPGFSKENIYTDEPATKTNSAVLHIGVDFNVANMNAVVFVKDNKNIRAIDEIQLKHNKANTYALIAEIKRRYPGRKILLYPDATGRNRSANTIDIENTNHKILRDAGFNLVFDHSGNPPREDRTLLVNSKIRAMDGTITLHVHKKCQNLINSLERRQYKNGLPEKDGITDHGTDCLDYVIWHLFSQRNGVQQYR